MDREQIQLGTTLYRYVEGGGIFKYTVICVREYERSSQYEVRCETCSHGWKCELLIAFDDRKKLSFVHMLNNDEEDNQDYWHSGDFHFFLNLDEAKLEGVDFHEHRLKKELADAQAKVDGIQKRLSVFEDLKTTLLSSPQPSHNVAET